ncbi:valine--tRNA ligase [Tetranychus urticae]|nr:valine--tRNA ligase [Tetranychus urticae]
MSEVKPEGDQVKVEIVKDDKKKKKEAEKAAKKAEKEAKFKLKQDKLNQAKKEGPVKDKAKDDKKKVKEVIIYEGNTKEGDEKDLSTPMPSAYSPEYVEAAWYSWWKKSGFFKPEINAPQGDITKDNGKGKFVMVIPPPNVTGSLHLGHALTCAIQDAITRWNRMKGKVTLWAPGCDHAGIATQTVVEKRLQREQGLTRHDLGRDKFIEEVWKWKNEKGNRIYEQFEALGCSVDWDRATFTMDPKMCTAITEAFVRLHEEGLIYRAKRLINWCCTLNSAISDIEVDKIEVKGPTPFRVPGYGNETVEFGILELFAYPVEDSDEKIIVSTTRIETMLGDTAVAVHPEDARYKHLHGKYVTHPLLERKIPIICDDFVEMEFGTGAVKITPAHDHTDYEVGKRHNLPFIDILNDDGSIAAGFGKYSGMKRFHARKEIGKDLDALGLYHGSKPNPMVVPVCSRSKDIIEPKIKAQWFVDCKEMANKAVEAVKTGELTLIPESHNKIWFQWLENIQDWCISRQIWWGHRIPAYKVSCSDPNVNIDPSDNWVSGRNLEEAMTKASVKYSVPKDKINLEQDEDVLDTWFSSGQFPFAIFGWPEKTKDLDAFYPGDLLETGQDIIFFWVARMVMLGMKFCNKLPFTKVFLHSMVRDAHGRKMSKSLGNIIDPVDVIRGKTLAELQKMLDESNLAPAEIEKAKASQRIDFPEGIPPCGTDALRFTLCDYLGQGRDINLDIKRVEGYRSFCNKLWNAVKFSLMTLGPDFKPNSKHNITGRETRLDLWLLSRLRTATEIANKGFEDYDFHSITSACHRLWVYEICDIYLECIKPFMRGDNEETKEIIRQTLYTACDIGLRLLHPFMPYLTEDLHKRLPRRCPSTDPPSLCITPYPEVEEFSWQNDPQLETEFSFMYDFVHKIRSRKANYGVEKKEVPLFVLCDSQETQNRLLSFIDPIKCLTHSSCLEMLQAGAIPPEGVPIPISDSCQAYLGLKGIIDIDKEIESLKSKKEQREKMLKELTASMSDPNFLEKVPKEVQETRRQKIEELNGELSKIIKSIDDFSLIVK